MVATSRIALLLAEGSRRRAMCGQGCEQRRRPTSSLLFSDSAARETNRGNSQRDLVVMAVRGQQAGPIWEPWRGRGVAQNRSNGFLHRGTLAKCSRPCEAATLLQFRVAVLSVCLLAVDLLLAPRQEVVRETGRELESGNKPPAHHALV